MSEQKQKEKSTTSRTLLALSWRIFFYAGLVIILLASVIFSIMQSEMAEIFLLDKITQGLQQLVEEKVSIRGLRLDLLNKTVTLYGLRIESKDPERFPDPFTVESIIVRASALSLMQGNLLIRNISLFQPEIDILQNVDGSSNIPTFKKLNTENGQLQVEIRQLDVSSGILSLNGREIGWEMASGGVSLKALSTGNNKYQGTGLVENILLRLPYTDSMKINLDVTFLSTARQLNLRADVTDQAGRDVAFNRLSFNVPGNRLELSSSFSFDLGQLKIWKENQVTGSVNLVSELLWENDKNPSVSLVIDSPEIMINDHPVSDIYADLSYSDAGIKSEEIRADLWGGKFRASGELKNPFAEAVFDGHVDMEGFQLRKFFAMLGINYLKVESELSMTAEAHLDFAKPENSTMDARLRGQVDARSYDAWINAVETNRQERNYSVLENASFPLAFSADIFMENGEFIVQPGSWIAVANSTVDLDGKISADNFRFKIRSSSIDSSEASLVLANVDRFFGASFPELEQVYGVASFIRLFNAGGRFNMDIRGPAEKMSYDLKVFAEGGEFVEHPIGQSDGNISFSGHTIKLDDLNFVIGGGSLLLNGTVELPAPGQPPTNPPKIKLNAKTTAIPLEDIAWVVNPQGTEELEGEIDADLNIEFIDPAKISGSGNIKLTNLGFRGNSIQSLESDISFGDTWGFTNLDLLGNEGEKISGSLEITPATNHWTADLKIRALDLSRYAAMFGEEADIGGSAEVDLSISGVLLEAQGTASFKVDNLYLQGAELGNVSGQLEAKGKEGTIRLNAGGKEYVINSEIKGENFDTLELNLAQDEIDLTPFVLNFIDDERFYLFVYDGISFKIKTGEKGFEKMDLSMGSVTVGIEQFALTSKNFKLSVDNKNRLVFKNVKILQGGQEGRNTSLSGYLNLGEEGALNLNLTGSMNLYSLSDFFPDFSFGGEGVIDLKLRGSLKSPLLYGSLSVNDGFLRHKETDLTFPDFNGDLRLNGERIELTSISSRFANGIVIMDGFIEMSWASMEPLSYQFTLQGNNIQHPFLPGVETTVDTSLAMRGSGPELSISGDINITRASYTLRFDPEAEFARFSNAEPLPVVDEKLRNVKLDIGIHGSESIRVDNNFAQMDLALDLRLLGNLAEPGMTGRAEVLSGEVFYRDRKYRINTGIIDFTNPNRIQPQFDFRAETQVKDYRVFLDFHGSPERLYPELSSDPVVSSIDILNLLAVGNIRENPFPSDNERVQERLLGLGLSGFLTKQITGEFERRAEDIFGIDRFRIDPFILERGASPTARVTIGEQITDELSVVYSSNLSKDDQQVLVFEYRLSPSLLLVGTREEDGSYAVDIHLQHRFK